MKPPVFYRSHDEPGGSGDPDNSTIRQLRTAHEEAVARARSLESKLSEVETKLTEATGKLTEIERSKMEETDRLRAEKADLEKSIGDLSSAGERAKELEEWAKSKYESAIGNVPEDKRESVTKLSAIGTWTQRLDSLEEAMALVASGAKEPVKVSHAKGADPGTPGGKPPEEPVKLDLKEVAKNPWSFNPTDPAHRVKGRNAITS